jgi:outer membrane immunogenic protein
MNRLAPVVVSVLILTLAGAARAADEMSWTGCSVGAHLGYGFGGSTYYDPQTALNGNPDNNAIDQSGRQQPFQMNESGVLAGAQAGCDYEFHRIVVGISDSFSGAAITGSGTDLHQNNNGASGLMSAKTDWLNDVSLRAGYDVGPALLYVKGGPAWARKNYSFVVGYTLGLAENGQSTLNGRVLGLGGEWPVSKNFTAFAEADEYYFPGATANLISLSSFSNSTMSTPVIASETIKVVKVGFNYRWSFAKN